jgi:5-bromo-4-chloroindolyl phosphate hydrolysis protein
MLRRVPKRTSPVRQVPPTREDPMGLSSQEEREVRAARNQALFRVVNENLRTLHEAFASVTGTFTIACECADRSCVEMLEIEPQEYLSIRAEPRHFAVLPEHVYPEVEVVVRESDRYVVVEKTAAAAEVAESLAEELDTDHR